LNFITFTIELEKEDLESIQSVKNLLNKHWHSNGESK
jgi:hypothetical protein